MDDGLLLASLPKTVVYLLSQLAIGLLIVRWLHARPDAATATWQRRAALVLALLLLPALLLRLWVQTAAAFGAADASLPENLWLIGVESRWGGGWRMQLYAAGAMGLTAIPLAAWRTTWTPFAVSAVALCVVMPALGHAGGSVPRHVLHAIHNLAGAAWIGTLGVLTLLAWRRSGGGAAALSSTLPRFSPLALTAASLVAASGVIAAWLYVGTLEALLATDYGRLLLFKLGAVSLVALCGAINWRGVRRGAPPQRGVMTLEWSAAILVLVLTGVLTETANP